MTTVLMTAKATVRYNKTHQIQSKEVIHNTTTPIAMIEISTIPRIKKLMSGI